MNNKKVVITGGFGGIGYALAKRLKDEFDVLILDNKIGENKDNISTIECDLTDPIIEKYISDADYIFHLACIKPTGRGTTKEEYFKNIKMTENLAKYNKKAKIIYASAGTIYGSQDNFPIKENASITCNISDYYCRGKWESEVLLGNYSIKNHWALVILRVTNVYGPKFRRKGEIIPEFYSNLIRNRKIIVYGNGKQRRDRIFIDDLVEALYLSIPEKIDGIFNIGSGKSYSSIKVAELIGKLVRKKPIFDFYEDNGLKRDDNLLDISKAKSIMKFKPKISFKKGLKIIIKGWIEEKWSF